MGVLLTAVVFDLDGVVADTERLSLRSFAETYEALGVPLGRSDLDDLAGLSLGRVDALVRGRHPVQASFEEIRDDYRRRYLARLEAGVPALPGVLPLLESAAAAGVPVAVASSSPRSQIELVLASTGAAPWVRVVAAGDEVEATKPAPDVYLLALERLGVGAEGAVAIEDTAAGLAAALAAGLRCVGVGPGTLAGASLAVGSLEELTLARLGELVRPRRPEARR